MTFAEPLALLPFDHAGATSPDANALQRFIDSGFGKVLANASHSAGALLFTVGLGLFVYQAWLLRRQSTPAAADSRILGAAQASTLLGIALNAAGGLMRLYQSGHPRLARVGQEAWVQVMLIKHVFLLLGVGLAVYVSWRTWRTHTRTVDGPARRRESTRIVALCVTSLGTILLATVLGAVAANVPLQPATGSDDANDHGVEGLEPPLPDFVSIPGTIVLATAAQPSTASHTFQVGADRDKLVVTLTWTSSTAQFNLTLRDPEGRTPPAAYQGTTANWTVTVAGPAVRAGAWTLAVRSDQAVNEAYRLTATATSGTLVERTVTVPGDRKFFEANLRMTGPKTLNYSWEVVGSDATLFFDVHVHHAATQTFDEPVAGEWNHRGGRYAHVFTDTDEASLLWQNNATAPITLHVRFWGHFEVDSFYPREAGSGQAEGLHERAQDAAAQDHVRHVCVEDA